MDEARQPDSTHSMLRGDSSIQLSFSRVQSPRTYLVPLWHQTPNMSLGKLASAAAAGVANAVRAATVFKRRFTDTSCQRKGSAPQRHPGCGRGGSAGGRGGFGYGGGFGFVIIPLHPRCTVQSSPRSYSAMVTACVSCAASRPQSQRVASAL